MDEVVSKGETKIVQSDCKAFIVLMSHLIELFLLSYSANFYMDISGKVLYIHH